MMTAQVAIVAVLLTTVALTPTFTQEKASAEQRKELTDRLVMAGQCNRACASGLAGLLLDEGVDIGLAVAALAKGGATPLKGKVGVLAFYQLLRNIRDISESGAKIIDKYKACSDKCDAMYDDVNALARAGLLGPIVHGTPIPEEWFIDAKVKAIWDKYIKALKPIDLPAAFQNDARWKALMNTA